jgi:Nuclease-related domain/AAA domain
MAIPIPTDSRLIDNHNERHVFEAFRDGLDDEWYVIAGVKGTEREGKARPREWEADVTVFHPNHGVIVIEVKGGEIKLCDGEWTQNGEHLSDPIEQCRDAAGPLSRRLKAAVGRNVRIPRSIAVCFPTHDVSVVPNDALDDELLPRELLAPEVAARLQAWVNARIDVDEMQLELSLEEAKKALNALNPQVRTGANPKREVEERLRVLESLTGEVLKPTDEQIAAFEEIKANQRICLLGGAGTGKTLLGISAAKRVAEGGSRVLFLTAGGRLHERITEEFKTSEVAVKTVSEFVKELCLAAGVPVPEVPESPSKRRAYDLEVEEDHLLEQFVSDPPSGALGLIDFDFVVLDEAQSRSEGFLGNLSMLFSLNDAKMLILADPLQRVEPGVWVPPQEYTSILLNTNCRNADLICYLLQLITGRSQIARSAKGLSVSIRLVEGGKEVKGLSEEFAYLAKSEVKRLRTLGLQDIVIVTHGWDVEELREALGAESTVPIESVIGYRGCESDAVIAVLPRASRFPLYISVSRARLALSIIARRHSFDEVASEDLRSAVYDEQRGERPDVESLHQLFFSES